ncbi:hypothetical protein VV02_10820 [Luteipulveratus mongoliensis]|uniref:3-hydroxyacyl-CoA dehydrogenase n=1 Tax=Luteipulveratus mongoliensis TaxID=571913 RepID=A0A0K1JQ34_9MICO|nr:hypothetical protein VV02_10820 [Luteipulveratus mongoliensis]
MPDPLAWAHQVLLAALECSVGVRTPQQLTRWMTIDVHERVARRHKVAQRRGRRPVDRPQVRRVRVTEPSDGVVEASALVLLDGRLRAVALRLNGVDGRWLMTELVIG